MAPVTVTSLLEQKRAGKKIAALTAYDAPFARIMDETGVDIILVGDSVGMTALGRRDTLSVTVDDMIHHAKAVVAAVRNAMVVVDMPFMSFQVSAEKALENAGRIMQEAGAHGVKLEGGEKYADRIRAIAEAGIPVMGHIGLTPQSYLQFGGYKVQGKQGESARRLLADARAVEKAGAFSMVLEAIPADLAATITASLHIPSIGIGAGAGCDGQILVMHDMLGLSDGPHPRFVKLFADLRGQAQAAFADYIREVRGGAFPAKEHTYSALAETPLKVVGEKKNRG